MQVVFERGYYSRAVDNGASIGSKTKINTNLLPKHQYKTLWGVVGAGMVGEGLILKRNNSLHSR